MAKQIFVNLPVKNLDMSIAFFTKLGFTFNPQFTDENGTCMIIGENIFAMLLAENFFKTFTVKPVADARKGTEVILALALCSREEVDEVVRKAVEAGGAIPNPKQDHGWMYSHGFEDLDGHVWEVLFMDESAIPTAE